MSEPVRTIRSRTIGEYLDDLGSTSPAPGGGSVAALTGALAAGLGCMVASLTRNPSEDLVAASESLERISSQLTDFADRDEVAYRQYVEASRMSKESEEDKTSRSLAMQAALVNAADIPLGSAAAAADLLDPLKTVIVHGKKQILSDADIAISLTVAAISAALVNVRVNIPLITDHGTSSRLSTQAVSIEERSAERSAQCRTELALRLA